MAWNDSSQAAGETGALVAKTLTALAKVVATAGTGVPLVASETFTRKVWLSAGKVGGANTGIVYLGTSTVDKTTDQQMPLAPGDVIVVEMPPGTKLDLATMYVDAATSSDAVTGWYIPA